MKLEEAIKIKEKYQYILRDASFPELIIADNLSIEALKLIERMRAEGCTFFTMLLPGETKE